MVSGEGSRRSQKDSMNCSRSSSVFRALNVDFSSSDDVGDIFVKPLSQGPVSFFLRPRFAVLLPGFLLFRFALFLGGNREGRSQKNQGRQANNNRPTAHKRTSIRVVSIASINDLVS